MDRRQFLALTAALPAVAALLQACGGDDAGTPTTSTVAGGAEPQAVRSEVARAKVDPALAAVAAEAINTFGADLYRELTAAKPDTNLVFSPASILLALAMTRAGAAGTTATEMDTVLHIADTGEFFPACNALAVALDGVSGPVENSAGEPDDVALEIANSLWAQAGLAFEQAFLDVLARDFGAGLETVDYRSDPEAARELINAWVAAHTNDRIPELLGEGTITEDARLTLVNAVYLKAPWRTSFDADDTEPAPFTTAAGTEVEVQMMGDERYVGYLQGTGWQAVEVPYAGDRLAMVLVLPEGDVAGLDGAGFAWPASTEFGSEKVRLGVPRWDFETSASLGDALGALGMPTAFTGAADFSGMTAAETLAIGAVIHQANITVDEYGTEAAAATAVVMEATSAAPGATPPAVILDRPFLFAVREIETGAILFQGRVSDPTA